MLIRANTARPVITGLAVFALISISLGVAEVRELARELRYRVIPR